jgi:colanic acid/amylovoran biosynthesis protein
MTMKHPTISSSRTADIPLDRRDRPPKLCVFGVPPRTGNLGVTAMHLALLTAITRRAENPLITVFDDRAGIRPETARVAGRDVDYRLCGAIPTRRIYRRHSLWQIRTSGRLGGLGNPVIKAIRRADAVLDVTGGDSFTDLYGPRRFRWVTLDKLITLEQNRPLILLPQTIGPFHGERARRIARRILHSAMMVWARDATSFTVLRDLLGADFDNERHRCGVDLAFGLEDRTPAQPLPEPIASWFADDGRRPIVGCNVSGLIFNNPAAAKARFGLRAEYDRAVILFLRRILHQTDANVLLVPHVLTEHGHHEHDPDACASVAEALREADGRRVAIVGGGYDPCEMKWIIGQCDWFCGTRMHAGIAALSSGVPTAAIAYSRKTLGVFDTCGQGPHVADPRELDTADVVERLWHSWTQRQSAAAHLRHRLPFVLQQAQTQMDEVLASCGIAPPTMTSLRKAA